MGVPFSYLTLFPSGSLYGTEQSPSIFNGYIFLADVLLWAMATAAAILLIGGNKSNSVRKTK